MESAVVSDPTTDTFREMLLEARIEEAEHARESLGGLDKKVEEAEARWDEDTFREAVAGVLADALREAGHLDREALIRSISPNILSTVRSEIGTAHPEIIEALSPRMGELIRASVAKAVEGLQRQIDEAVPVDLWIASIRGAVTGTPSTGWILRDKSGFRVIEAFLIERGSGLILAQDRPQGEDADVATLDDDLLGGMIAALDSFARDAFGSDGIDELRQLTLSAGTMYLRASPTKILALRCTGVAPPKVEDRIDRLLDSIIQRLQEEGGDALPARLLAMEESQAEEDAAEPSAGAAAMVGQIALAVVAVIVAFWSHGALERANDNRWVQATLDAVREDPAMIGYPVVATQAEGVVTLTGLVPDTETRAGIERRIAALTLPFEAVLAMPEAGKRLQP